MMSSLLYLSLCVALLSSAALTALAELSVRPAESYAVLEGESETIICDSETALFYSWEKDGIPIDGSVPGLVASDNTLSITNANHTLHRGRYSCTVTESDSFSFTADFTVAVHYIGSKTIMKRTYPDCVPDASTAYRGSTLTLECLAPEGEPMVNVTWYFNGVKLRQVDDPFINFSNRRKELVVGPLNISHAGRYQCQAANEVNRDEPLMSNTMFIHVHVRPAPDDNTVERSVEVLESETAVVVGEGLLAELRCKIIPQVPVQNVVWLHNHVPLEHSTADGIRFVQLGNSELSCYNSLYIDHVTADNEGTYECQFTGSNTDFHAQRDLFIAVLRGPLTVEAQPSQLLAAGKRLALLCGLSDSAQPQLNNVPIERLTYSWTHNGSTELGADVESVGDGRELVIPAARLRHSGQYVCSVNSPKDEIHSPINASVFVTIEAVPSISISLLGSDSLFERVEENTVYVQLGAHVALKCTINYPSPSNFTWRQQVEGESKFHDVPFSSSSGFSSTLTLPNLTPSQLASYHCNISNAIHNLVTQGLTLMETERPYVRDAAVGVKKEMFENGTMLKLVCQVRGRASGDFITWLRDGLELTNQTTVGAASSVAIVTNGNNSTLIISVATLREAGQYECVISVDGMESRLTYEVVITLAPKIVSASSPHITVATGESVQFDCVVSGIPPPVVRWLFDTQPVEQVSVPVQDLGNGSLRISNVTEDHAGPYHCYVEGQILQDFSLTVTPEESLSQHCGGGLKESDCVTLLAGGSVAVFFLLLALLVLLLCLSILCCRWVRATYHTSHHFQMKRVLSSRASTHKEGGAAAPVFGETNGYVETQGFRNGLYPVNPVLAKFDGTALSGMQRSVTPPAPSPVLRTPGTADTNSMFSSEDDQSSLTATLPNFPRSQLTLGPELGEGEFGPVLLGTARNIVSHEYTTQVVVKVLVRSGDGEDQFQPDLALVDFANQMKIDYEHIACILGMCTDMEPYCVIYEYLDQGDLKRYLQTHRPVPEQPEPHTLTPHTLSRLVLQVADGMAFLFSQRIIHGDLATRNCLVSSDNHIKIADLGIGHDLYPTDYHDNGSQLLPIRWMPPELLVATEDGPAFSLHSDVWSFGVLCWEVFTFGELPYEGVADEGVLVQVPQGLLLRLPPSDECPGHMTRVMAQCWQLDPETRPHFSALCMEMNVISGE